MCKHPGLFFVQVPRPSLRPTKGPSLRSGSDKRRCEKCPPEAAKNVHCFDVTNQPRRNIPMQTFRLPLIALLTILCVPIWALADGRGPDCYVLSVGISNYPRASKLNASLNDARSIATAFARQQGRAFGTVQARTLLDGDATRARISQGMRNFAKQGSAGDFFVVSLNGHGGLTGDNRSWHFYPFDHVPGDAGSNLTDKQILEDTDVLVKQGKKVAIIVDACYAGALRKSAQSYFSAYKNASGGLILMLSSGPEQTSAGLASYSPFARRLPMAWAERPTSTGTARSPWTSCDSAISPAPMNCFALNRGRSGRTANSPGRRPTSPTCRWLILKMLSVSLPPSTNCLTDMPTGPLRSTPWEPVPCHCITLRTGRDDWTEPQPMSARCTEELP